MPADNYTPSPDDPLGGPPILFRPSTFATHELILSQVEEQDNSLYPRAGRGRTTKPSAGQWGFLASGHTIGAAAGLVLGTGNVQLCSRSGTTLTADGDTVSVLNSGAAIVGPKALELDWTDGQFAVCECGTVLTVTCMFCKPCNLPTKTLGYGYAGTAPLSPTSGSGLIVWDGSSDWASDPFAGGYTIDLQCVSGTVTPRIMLSGVSQCTFDAPISTSCNGLSLTYNVPDPSAAATAGFLQIQIADPGPPTHCPVPCAPCIGCPQVVCGDITGITLLPGGTVTDELGTHSLTGAITADLLSSPRPLIEGVDNCFVMGSIQVPYHLTVQCDLAVSGKVAVTVNTIVDSNNIAYALQELHNAPPVCDDSWVCGWYPSPPSFTTQRVTPTCSGGFLTGTVTFPGMPGVHCGPVPYVVTDVSFSIPYAVDPMCQSFLVVGCNGLGIAGATLNLYDVHGGTLLFSGTTNSGGGIPQVFFPNADNPFWIEVTSPTARLQDSDASHTLVCGSPPTNQTTVTLPPDNDHVCAAGCPTPLAKTLHATHPTFGAITLVYNATGSLGAGWYATVSYSYTGCRCCPSKTVTVTCFLNTSLIFSDNWKSN